MNKPTPADFARELAERFGPAPDPANPYFKPAEVAVRRLLIQAVSEVLGARDPFAHFARAYERAYVLAFPVGYSEARAAKLEDCVEEMREAWEVIEEDILRTIDVMRE